MSWFNLDFVDSAEMESSPLDLDLFMLYNDCLVTAQKDSTELRQACAADGSISAHDMQPDQQN
jgi:hypothetical protein